MDNKELFNKICQLAKSIEMGEIKEELFINGIFCALSAFLIDPNGADYIERTAMFVNSICSEATLIEDWLC